MNYENVFPKAILIAMIIYFVFSDCYLRFRKGNKVKQCCVLCIVGPLIIYYFAYALIEIVCIYKAV